MTPAGSSGFITGFSVLSPDEQHIYAVSQFDPNGDVDFGDGIVVQPSGGYACHVIAKWRTSDGLPVAATSVCGVSDEPYGLAVDSQNNVGCGCIYAVSCPFAGILQTFFHPDEMQFSFILPYSLSLHISPSFPVGHRRLLQ